MQSDQYDPPPITHPTLVNLRRRALPLASAAASLGLAGCSLWPFGHQAALDTTPQATQPAAPRKTAQQVQAFTADLDTALEKVDRDTLTHPATRKTSPAQAVTPVDPSQNEANAPATTPPSASPPTNHFSPSPLAPLGLAEFGQPFLQSATTPLFMSSLAPVAPAPLTIAPAPCGSFDLTSPPPPLLAVTTPTSQLPAPAAPSPAPALPPGRFQVRDGPPEVSVSTSLPEQETSATSPIYTVYSPRKAPVTVSSPAEVTPALASAPEKTAEPSIDIALEMIRKQAAAHPSLNTALAISLLEQSEARPPNADTARDLPAIDQQLLQDLASALQSMAPPPAAGATLSERTAPLLEAAKKWQTQADLKLPKLLLTSRVDSYGVYSPIEPKFPAGKKQTVIIYCEVANFVPKKTDDAGGGGGWYETRLTQQETLATDDGLLLFRPNAEEVVDRSKNPRRDFYLVKKLTIPDNLAIGKYSLRMSVTDLNTNKIAVVSLPIEITR